MTDLLARAAVPDLSSPVDVDEVDGTLICREIIDVTHDVKSFAFEIPGGAQLRFLPGQYLTFEFEVDGAYVQRCYTISASPAGGDLTITVKRVPGGPVSNWLHDRLRPGDRVRASGPFGQFSCAVYPAQKYLFLTAGSGITPAMSMVRTLRDTGDPAHVVFVHSARTPADIIFRDEIDTLAAIHGVSVSIVCEDDSPHERWEGARGRLTLRELLGAAPDLLEREIFTCGPPPYMQAVRDLTDALGVDHARYHEESFLLDEQRPVGDDGAAVTSHQIEFRRSRRVVDCDSATTILDAAANAGLSLPASCGEGVCGTCKLQQVSGTVDMRHAGGIRPREIDQGKILPCCSTPSSDVVLDA